MYSAANSSVREQPVSNNEKQFIVQALAQGTHRTDLSVVFVRCNMHSTVASCLFSIYLLFVGIRIDGRTPNDLRNIVVSFGAVSGSVDVAMGASRVVATVTGDIVQPLPHKPTEGELRVFLNCSQMASPYVEQGR